MVPHLHTKIVCTIGPASREPEQLSQLIEAGMDVVRLNFSHGDHATHAETIRRVREAASKTGKAVAILGDLQGPKLRVGVMQEGGVPITAGETLVMTTDDIVGGPGRVPVQYELLPQVLAPGDRILIDDGLLEVKVEQIDGTDIVTRVVTGGVLNSNKGMNLPRAALSIPAITDKDREDLAFAIEQGIDWMALSFVRTSQEVWDLKGYIRQLSAFGRRTPVISKIEKPEAITNIDDIIAASDGIMVARGDLGIELSPEAVPMLQKQIIAKCNALGKPVITATQMLDSMIRNPRPNPRRSLGRGERNPRRLGCDHAVGRDRVGQVPAAGRADNGAHRAGGRTGAAIGRPQAAGRQGGAHVRRGGLARVGRNRAGLERRRHHHPDSIRFDGPRRLALPAALPDRGRHAQPLRATRARVVLGRIPAVVSTRRVHRCGDCRCGRDGPGRRVCQRGRRADRDGRLGGRGRRDDQRDEGAPDRAGAWCGGTAWATGR